MRINGICGGWYTAYGYRPHDTRGTGVSVVSVSLFRTRADALAYFASIGRPPLPPKGVGMRTEVFPETDVHGVVHQVGNVVSVVRRVVISSGGRGKPPAYRGSEAVRAQVRIHRRIQTAVLASD